MTNAQFQTLVAKLEEHEVKNDRQFELLFGEIHGLGRRLDSAETRLERIESRVETGLKSLETRLGALEREVGAHREAMVKLLLPLPDSIERIDQRLSRLEKAA
jgi:predicted  nucleic acid-binding Zn-ribbon protein